MVIPLLGGAAGAVAAGILAHAVRSPRSTLLAPSVDRGVSGRKAIALTFDDGPSESTPALLDLLSRHGARATFFQCGMNARRLPRIAREVAEAGHEIGNHTDSHPKLHFRSPAFIYEEMARAQTTIEETTGARPRLFRAPFGIRWFGLRAAQARLGLLGVMWTAIGLDWKWSAEAVIARLLAHAGNGAIFCLHDGRAVRPNPDIRVTLDAVGELLPALAARGFQFETVTQILCPTT